MPSVPAISAILSGGKVRASTLRNALNFLLNPPIAKLRQTSTQSLTSGVAAAIQFQAEIVDTDIDGTGGHDNVTNNTRYTARYPGYYELIGGGVSFNNNGTGVRVCWWAVNGTGVNGSLTELPTATASTLCAVPAAGNLVYLSEGDYVELIALQNSGGALSTTAGSTDQPHASIKWASN